MQDIHSILKKTDEIGSRLRFSSSERKTGAATLLDLSHEHAKSVVLLIDAKHYGSAFALLRPCIEAYIRGSWLLYCASDSEVDRFVNRDTQWPSLSKQMKGIEGYYDLPGSFRRYLGKSMGVLDALTHGLSSQIKKRYSDGHIEFQITEEEVYDLIWEASYTSVMSHIVMAGIAEDEDATQQLQRLLPELRTLRELIKDDDEPK